MRVFQGSVSRTWMLAVALGLILLPAAPRLSTVARPPQDEDWTVPDSAKKVKNPVPAKRRQQNGRGQSDLYG